MFDASAHTCSKSWLDDWLALNHEQVCKTCFGFRVCWWGYHVFICLCACVASSLIFPASFSCLSLQGWFVSWECVSKHVGSIPNHVIYICCRFCACVFLTDAGFSMVDVGSRVWPIRAIAKTRQHVQTTAYLAVRVYIKSCCDDWCGCESCDHSISYVITQGRLRHTTNQTTKNVRPSNIRPSTKPQLVNQYISSTPNQLSLLTCCGWAVCRRVCICSPNCNVYCVLCGECADSGNLTWTICSLWLVVGNRAARSGIDARWLVDHFRTVSCKLLDSVTVIGILLFRWLFAIWSLLPLIPDIFSAVMCVVGAVAVVLLLLRLLQSS